MKYSVLCLKAVFISLCIRFIIYLEQIFTLVCFLIEKEITYSEWYKSFYLL